LFAKLISLAMTALFVISTLALILTYRRPKKFSPRSQAITILLSLLSLLVFSYFTKYTPSGLLWFTMLTVGFIIGLIQARTTRVFMKDNRVMSQNSVWYLGLWAGIFAINQLVTTLTGRPPGVAMALLILSTATTWGTGGDILRRAGKLKAQAVPSPSSPTAPIAKGRHCGNCGAVLGQRDTFCGGCGAATTS